MALITLNTVHARDEIDLIILQQKTKIVSRITGVEHIEATQDNGDGSFNYTVSALEEDVTTMDYLLGMMEAVVVIEQIEQQAADMAATAAATLQ